MNPTENFISYCLKEEMDLNLNFELKLCSFKFKFWIKAM